MDVHTQKRLDEIGTRFIRSAADQLPDLEVLTARIHDGDPAGLSELEKLTHQLHGSAAMFHFDAVSAKAGKLNKLLKSFEVECGTWNVAQLDSLFIDLTDAVRDAAANRRRRSTDNSLEWPDRGRDAVRAPRG